MLDKCIVNLCAFLNLCAFYAYNITRTTSRKINRAYHCEAYSRIMLDDRLCKWQDYIVLVTSLLHVTRIIKFAAQLALAHPRSFTVTRVLLTSIAIFESRHLPRQHCSASHFANPSLTSRTSLKHADSSTSHHDVLPPRGWPHMCSSNRAAGRSIKSCRRSIHHVSGPVMGKYVRDTRLDQ